LANLNWKLTFPSMQFRVEADLGRFSEAIYKKVTSDAKRERFQGFRPGTIPPHLLPTYTAFSMDECARETVLEAMQQNNIRPFDNARSEFVLENFVILPPAAKKNKENKKTKKVPTEEPEPVEVVEEPQWRTFPDMKGAIDAGWRVS
jgi:Bacterial trigger factor protein (TF)